MGRRRSPHGLLPRKIDGAAKAHVALFAVQIELQGKGVLVLQRDGVAGAVLPGKGGVPLLIRLEGHLRGAFVVEQVGFLHVQLRVGGDVAGGQGQLVALGLGIRGQEAHGVGVRRGGLKKALVGVAGGLQPVALQRPGAGVGLPVVPFRVDGKIAHALGFHHMAVLAGKEGAEYQLFAGAGVQLHLGVGGDIADVAQQQDGLAVLAVIKLLSALERVFGIVCQARLVDEQGGIRVLREDAVQIAPAIRCHDPVILRDVVDEAPQIPQIGLAVQHLLHIGNEHEIKIYNARGVYSIPMAEFALCGVLQLIKQSRLFYKNQNNHIWEKSRTLGELSGKTVLIVGAGNIGSEVAKRFSAFDASVIGVDITDDDRKYFDKVELLDNLDEQLKIADIVILTLPLTDSTRGMFDKSKFDLMKKSSIFVNIARGPLVVESDLINSLKSDDISGAVLDVFGEEPLNENSPLWDMDNVILTPHNSFVGENNNKRMFNVIVNNLEKRNE